MSLHTQLLRGLLVLPGLLLLALAGIAVPRGEQAADSPAQPSAAAAADGAVVVMRREEVAAR
jgi:hypothetical protein